jgi:hypothetical protein
VGGDADDVDLAGGDLEEEQDVDPFQEHGVDGEEVAGQDGVGLGSEELPPGRPAAARCGIDTGLVQDLPDGTGRCLVPETDEFALYPTMPPGRVLRSEAQDQVADLPADGWPGRVARADRSSVWRSAAGASAAGWPG